MSTVLNALLMSKATVTMRCGGLGLLKPLVICFLFYLSTYSFDSQESDGGANTQDK